MDMSETKNTVFPSVGCHGIKELPTAVEKEYLDAMRQIKTRVRNLKNHRNLMRADSKSAPAKTGDLGGLSEIDMELSQLKKEWKVLEKKWGEAVKDRMIRLGHDEAQEVE
jgi:hypothetical protein